MADARWQPDDTFHDIIDGEYKGVLRVKKALEELGLELGDEVVTSRDPGMDRLRDILYRDTMPEGLQQWQLPIILGGGERPVMPFITVGQPNAEVPRHAHKDDCLLRIVLSGTIIHDGNVELTTGDWIYIPTGQPYQFTAGKHGCVIMHMYNGSGLYWRQRSGSSST